jgi:hypothetical protein
LGNCATSYGCFCTSLFFHVFLLHLEISCADYPPVEKPQFSAQAVAEICQLAGLRKLNLSNVGLDDEHFGSIAQQISQKSNCLTELFLNENHNTDRGLDMVTTLILDNPFSPLQKFQAYQSQRVISDESLDLIIKAFRQNCTLTGLWLHTAEQSLDVEFYLQLNQAGRRVLVDRDATHSDWIHLLVTAAREPPLLYYVVQHSNFWWQFIAKGGTSSKYDFFRQGSEVVSRTKSLALRSASTPVGEGLSPRGTSTKNPLTNRQKTHSEKSPILEPYDVTEEIATPTESHPVVTNLLQSIDLVDINEGEGIGDLSVNKSNPIVDGPLGIETEGSLGLFRMISKPFFNQPQENPTHSSSKSSKHVHTDVGNDLFARMKNASESLLKGETKERRPEASRAQNNQKSLAEQRAEQELLLREKLKELDPDLEGAMLAQKVTQQLLVQKIVGDQETKAKITSDQETKAKITSDQETKAKITSDQETKANGDDREEWKKFLDQDDSYVDAFHDSPQSTDDVSVGNLSTGRSQTCLREASHLFLQRTSVQKLNRIRKRRCLADDLRGIRRRKHAWNQEGAMDPESTAIEINKDRNENAAVDREERISHLGKGIVEATEKMSGQGCTSGESTGSPWSSLEDTLTKGMGSGVACRTDVNRVFPEPAPQYTPEPPGDRDDIKGTHLSQSRTIIHSIDAARLKTAKNNITLSKSPKKPDTNQDVNDTTSHMYLHSEQGRNCNDEEVTNKSKTQGTKASTKTTRSSSPKVKLAVEVAPEALVGTTEILPHARGSTYGMTHTLGAVHDAALSDATDERPAIVVLVSKSFGRHSQMSNQNRAITCLRSRRIPFVEVDGSNPLSRAYRDQLFDISGVRGSYPEFFVRSGGEITYLGDLGAFEAMNESDTLPFKGMTAAEQKDVKPQPFEGTQESDETKTTKKLPKKRRRAV